MMAPVRCANRLCRVPIGREARLCATCGWDNGCPNVRQAREQGERLALRSRVRRAESRARERGCADALAVFREQVRRSVAVLATTTNKAKALLESGTESFTSFYRLLDAGARRPAENWFDEVRGVADALLFPNYREHMQFAALSLDGVGCSYYGRVQLELAGFAIERRASVFEENSLLFCKKHALGVFRPMPKGYRATWEDRDKLAAAKLEPWLQAGHSDRDFPGILLSRPGAEDADFVEVHLYDCLTRESVAKINFVKARASDDDMIMWSLICQAASKLGIPCQEVA